LKELRVFCPNVLELWVCSCSIRI